MSWVAGFRNQLQIIRQFSPFTIAYTVRWQNFFDGENQEHYNKKIVRKPSTQLRRRSLTGQVPILGPGQVAFVTPLFNWESSAYTARVFDPSFHGNPLGSRRLKRYAAKMPRAHGFMTRAKDAKITVALVAEINSQRAPQGPKAQGLAKYIQVRRNAEPDEAAHLLHVDVTQGTVELAALSLRIRQSIWASQRPGAAGERLYLRTRAGFAKKVGHLAEVASASKVQETLNFVALSPTNI